MVQNLQYTPYARLALEADKSSICLQSLPPSPITGSLMYKINVAMHSLWLEMQLKFFIAFMKLMMLICLLNKQKKMTKWFPAAVIKAA